MKLFLDTNILIDYFGQKPPYGAHARELAAVGVFGEAELWVSAKSFTDVFFVLKKYVAPDKLQEAFSQSLQVFAVCSIDKQDIASACAQGWPDYEDALIDVAARKVKADYIVTRDAGFSKSRTPTRTPEQIVAAFAERGVSFAEYVAS